MPQIDNAPRSRHSSAPAAVRRRPVRRSALAGVALAAMAVLLGAFLAAGTGTAAAAPSAPAAVSAAAEPGDTTTTLPRDNRNMGNSITKPNQGADPTSPGDPGGWLQVSLFYLVLASIVAIAGLVWYSSRRARRRRDAAGLDPVTIARAKGTGVRAPSPLRTSAAGAAAGGPGSTPTSSDAS
jgi:heme A synthase